MRVLKMIAHPSLVSYDKDMDWYAQFDDQEEGPCGYGATKEAAIQDFLANWAEDIAETRLCRDGEPYRIELPK